MADEFPFIYLVSACMVGLRTRYDGQTRPSPACRRAIGSNIWIPVCPEQLGGLPTPRPAADIIGGTGEEVLAGRARVVTRQGTDVTGFFIAGAEQVLAIARAQPVAAVFLKSRSPSCGVSPLPGVTAALLLAHGFEVREF
ncbi:MAG: DUF523 domain-containing protein [Desulfobacterales bacterium]|nr:DUF523 domain-containing protein [Desulfobacterales bacterium]